MAVTVTASGTVLPVLNTVATLATVSAAGVYVLTADLSALVLGDVLELRVSNKVLSTSTAARAITGVYAHSQGEPVVFSVPVPVAFGATFSLVQTSGTALSIPWALLQIG